MIDPNTHQKFVLFLQDNIKLVLNHTTNRLPLDYQDKIIGAGITIISDNDLTSIKTPYVNLETYTVVIQDTFLCYLWGCCYSMVVINDLIYQKAKFEEPVVNFKGTPEFKTVQRTLGWARSLKNSYSLWPIEASNPLAADRYVDGSNNLFEASMLYIIFHEISHLLFHAQRTDLLAALRKPVKQRADSERQIIYDAEVEADQSAFNFLSISSDQEDAKFIKYLGAIVAQLSNFFLLDVPDTRGFSHPDMDTRLKSVIRQVELKEEYHRIHFEAHCSVGLQLFMSLTGVEFIPEIGKEKEFKDFEALEDYLFRKIEEIKETARIYSQESLN